MVLTLEIGTLLILLLVSLMIGLVAGYQASRFIYEDAEELFDIEEEKYRHNLARKEAGEIFQDNSGEWFDSSWGRVGIPNDYFEKRNSPHTPKQSHADDCVRLLCGDCSNCKE